jgi:hypothetical protein
LIWAFAEPAAITTAANEAATAQFHRQIRVMLKLLARLKGVQQSSRGPGDEWLAQINRRS